MIVQRCQKFRCQELTRPDTFTTRLDLRLLLLTEDTLEKKKRKIGRKMRYSFNPRK